MESSLARLSSGSSRNVLLLLEKLEPKKSAGLTGSTEKNSGLKSLIFQKQKNIFLRLNKNHFSCKKRTNWDPSAVQVFQMVI
jgi:hypothetical protein